MGPQPLAPGFLPLSDPRTSSPWLGPPQGQAACLAPQNPLTCPLTLYVYGKVVRELPGKRELFSGLCMLCVYASDTQRLKAGGRIEIPVTTPVT